MDNDSRVRSTVERISGEVIEYSINKHRCVVFLTGSFAVKVRRDEDVTLQKVLCEASWLRREGLETSVEQAYVNGRRLYMLKMTRLGECDCVGRKLALGRLSGQECQTVFDRLSQPVEKARVPRLSKHELRLQLLRNFERQATLGMVKDGVDNWRNALRSALKTWNHCDTPCITAAHRNAFSPNVFLNDVRGVVIIDPRCGEDTFSSLPWYGDAATFAVDLLLYSWPLDYIRTKSGLDRDTDDWAAFVAVILVKLLVRFRFAGYEIGGEKEQWRASQNKLVRQRAHLVASSIVTSWR